MNVRVLVLSLLFVSPSMARAADAPPDYDATAPASDDELSQLSRGITSRVTKALQEPCLANARTALSVRDLETGHVLFQRMGDVPLVPASNQKLLTSAALLAVLGPEHVRWTEFRGTQSPGPDGDVGELHVVGAGDPALTVEALHAACREVAAAGVRRVSAVVIDDTFFAGPRRPPSWPQRNHRFWYGAPVAALSTNFAVVAVHAQGESDGLPARAWVDPFPSFFEVQASLRSGRGTWSIRSESLASPPGGPGQRLTVSGRMRPGRTERELRAVEDPALFAGHGIVESLERLGVTVDGPVLRGRAPAESVLLHAHPSKPLALLVHDMNKASSNVFAETLLQVLGAEMLGPPGTREKGIAVLDRFLRSTSGRTAGCHLEDGSGLSPDNLLTANVLTDLLLFSHADPYTWPEFLVALPVGGVDGTLKRRLDDGRARRLVRAKTGRLARVVALSGLTQVAPGRRAVFSLLVNDYHCPTWKVQDKVDALLEALVRDAPRAPNLRARVPVDDLRERFDGSRAAESGRRDAAGGQ